MAVARLIDCTGVERSPGPLEDRDAQDAGEAQAHDDEDDPADDAQRGEVVVERPGRVRRGQRRGA